MMPDKEKQMYEKFKKNPKYRDSPDHLTTSAIVVDENRENILLIYHKKYDSWSWIGGHVERGETFIESSSRELCEETGLCNKKPVSDLPISCEKLYAIDHYHYNMTYLYICDPEEKLVLNTDETDGVRWFPLDSLDEVVTEKEMLPVYRRILKRI